MTSLVLTGCLVNGKMGYSDPVADRPYHHGDLRRALLDAAVLQLETTSVSELSLRALARRIGVSHAAPAHHFGDKAGLIEAISREGYIGLRQALSDAWEEGASFLDVGVSYVAWAVGHPVHYRLMFGAESEKPGDLDDVRSATRELLYGPAAQLSGDKDVALAGWSMAHGLAQLLIDGQVKDRRSVKRLATEVLSKLA